MMAAVSGAMAACACAADFEHSLSGTKPWTNEGFLDDPQEFHFAVLGDRTGSERKGFFEDALKSLNLLRPSFVVSVGDLIAQANEPEDVLRGYWSELAGYVARLKMPFFYVVGNHDIATGITGMTPERAGSIRLWKELHGTNTYYNFMYKGCHFVCLDSMEEHDYYPPREPLPQHQVDWAASQMERHADARWHFIFMHKPLDWTSDRWLAFERRINRFDYSVFAGDWHNHCTAVRHGKKYYLVGTAGGGFDCNVKRDDLRYGIMDSITWVTMTTNGPVVANLALSGIHGDTIQTCATTKGWIETPLDYPSHLSESPRLYENVRNTALIPAEVMQGPGYDWHFRHAVILRQGRIYAEYPSKFSPDKKRVVLLGDETALRHASEYRGEAVFDMSFAGDRVENVIWRVIQGELSGYDPHKVVISVGRHNKDRNSEAEIGEALSQLERLVKARAPAAQVTVVPVVVR